MIQIKNFIFNSFQVNTYILYDETGEGIIIDPACGNESELEEITAFTRDHHIKLTKIVNTHGHIDHIVGISRVVNAFNIPFVINQEDAVLLEMAPQQAMVFGFELSEPPVPTEYIQEGDTLTFGNSSLSLFHVPGHSPGSIAFYSKDGEFVIVGDVLFAGSIGRTDLPGGSYDALISSIKNKLFSLPMETKVFSGHGPSTTIQHEYDTNPFLS